jgi:hypothetical protein
MRRRNARVRAAAVEAPFKLTVGQHGYRVVVIERVDRGGALEMRYTDPARHGRDRRVKERLSMPLRTPTGAIRAGVEKRIRAYALQRSTALTTTRNISMCDAQTTLLTLREGIATATTTGDGGVFLGQPRQRDDALRYLGRLTDDFLGAEHFWDQVQPHQIVAAMYRWIREHKRTTTIPTDAPKSKQPPMPGHRSLELALSTFERVAKWLINNGFAPKGSFQMPADWRKELARVWTEVIGTPYAAATSRHSTHHVQQLLRIMEDPRVEPRLKVAFELGAELRIGQIIGLNRSHLCLVGDQINPHGFLTIPRCGRKKGSTIALTPHQAQVVQHALREGYLCEFERALERRNIVDYPLFPGGKLRGGVARMRKKPMRWNRRTALDAFHAAERFAGIVPVDGRGWYGVRRVFSDEAPLHTSDDLVLENIGAHSTETRNKHYRDRQYPEVLRRAREARTEIRREILTL